MSQPIVADSSVRKSVRTVRQTSGGHRGGVTPCPLSAVREKRKRVQL